MIVLLSTAYFPPVSYFVALKQSDTVIVEASENFVKQSYRNRCRILTAQGSRDLVVPVKHGKGKKVPICNVQIDYDQPWQKNHWKSLETAYNRSPFFEYYKDHLQVFFEQRYNNLFEFNQAILMECLRFFNLRPSIEFTQEHQLQCPENKVDYRASIHPKLAVPVELQSKTYPQVFDDRQAFQQGLSILDLLFSQGPNAYSKL